jgi:hypothetical protein
MKPSNLEPLVALETHRPSPNHGNPENQRPISFKET